MPESSPTAELRQAERALRVACAARLIARRSTTTASVGCPGVAEGGAARNYYCMSCDGVIDFDFRGEHFTAAQSSTCTPSATNWVESTTAGQRLPRAGTLMAAGLVALGLIAFVVSYSGR